jgi:hypothetical protein
MEKESHEHGSVKTYDSSYVSLFLSDMFEAASTSSLSPVLEMTLSRQGQKSRGAW